MLHVTSYCALAAIVKKELHGLNRCSYASPDRPEICLARLLKADLVVTCSMWRSYHNREKLLNHLLIEMRTFRRGLDIRAAYDFDDSNGPTSFFSSHSELDIASESEPGGFTGDRFYASDHDRNKNFQENKDGGDSDAEYV
ncbi:unnamed protein product [Caenorhabditis brenneri]